MSEWDGRLPGQTTPSDGPRADEGLVEAMAKAMAAVYSKDSMLSGDCDWSREPNDRDYEAAQAALAAARSHEGM